MIGMGPPGYKRGSSFLGDAANDWYGYSVAISSDGNEIGCFRTFNDDNGSNSGHVKAYGYGTGIYGVNSMLV